MSKMKIYVRNVLPCAGELDVVIAFVDDGSGGREIQICIPRHYEASKFVGKDIYYEVKGDKVRLTPISAPRADKEHFARDEEVGEE